MTQIINKDEVQKTSSKKSIIKIANNFAQAQLELKKSLREHLEPFKIKRKRLLMIF